MTPLHVLEDFRENCQSQYEVDPETGCWNWTGTFRNGYAAFKTRPAYRLAYEALIGPVPDELPQIDHLCANLRCVNPDHLDPVTRTENIARGAKPHFEMRGVRGTLSDRLTLEERRDRVAALHDQKLTVRQIAEELKMPPTTVYNDLQKRGRTGKRGETDPPSDGLPAIVHEKYGGDVNKALEALGHAQSEIGRLGNELGQERARNENVRAELEEVRAENETAARAILDLETRLAELEAEAEEQRSGRAVEQLRERFGDEAVFNGREKIGPVLRLPGTGAQKAARARESLIGSTLPPPPSKEAGAVDSIMKGLLNPHA